jgi:hypothetical protein
VAVAAAVALILRPLQRSATGSSPTTPVRPRLVAVDLQRLCVPQPALRVPVELVGPLPVAAMKAATVSTLGTALQIGQARSVEATANVEDTAALRFVAEGACAVCLGVYIQALHEGALLRFYSPQGEAVEVTAQALDAQTQRNAEGGASHRAARTYWSPEFCTAEATLEIEIPAQAPLADVQIAVPGLSHFTHSAAEAESSGQVSGNATRKVGESGGCNLDATCSPEYLEQSRAVARMVYVKDGDSYLCTGALMNDATASATPLLPQRTPLHLQPGRGVDIDHRRVLPLCLLRQRRNQPCHAAPHGGRNTVAGSHGHRCGAAAAIWCIAFGRRLCRLVLWRGSRSGRHPGWAAPPQW